MTVEPRTRPGDIRDAALRLFTARGYHATTTRDIATRLPMTPEVRGLMQDAGLPEPQARLFRRLYRGDNARHTALPGNGLGLALCRTVIEQHGGGLDFVNVWSTDGETISGAEFRFTLPAADAPPAVAPPAPEAREPEPTAEARS